MSTTEPEALRPGKVVTQVESLDALVGAHPGALRSIYEAGRPADPADLGDAPRGRVLALNPPADLFLLTRPLVRATMTDLFPWKGKVFDQGGKSGQNVVFRGRRVLRFRTEIAASQLDGRPTLTLLYSDDALGHPWAVRHVFDELRSVGPGRAIGPAYLEILGLRKLLLWFGLEAR